MPSASDEQREMMRKWFGDPIDEFGPIEFLKSRGYVLTPGWEWEPKPGVTAYKDMEEKEWQCMRFLVDEWDFGGLVK